MADIAPIYEYAKLILGTDHTGHGFDHVKESSRNGQTDHCRRSTAK